MFFCAGPKIGPWYPQWKPAEQASKDQDGAIPVLNAGRMDHGVKQEPYRINKDVALLPLDFLARVVA